jgi:UDP-3-O-[3-hydroxymyristoyl] N-acetylglucosamine deacetylase
MFEPISRGGVGLHTGEECRVHLEPTPPGTGVVFVTADGSIQARPGAIDPASSRATDLLHGAARVRTVEHLLAALAWYGEADVSIEVDGPEIPILDGSAGPWVAALLAAGATPGPRFVEITAPLDVALDRSTASLRPLESDGDPLVSIELGYDEPIPLGPSRVVFRPRTDDFTAAFSAARTFALEREVDAIRAAGLARGGSLDNALVIGENGPLNPCGCRFPDEPARHKLVDALGDLFLLGALPWAEIHAVRPGHRLLHELVRRAAEHLGRVLP